MLAGEDIESFPEDEFYLQAFYRLSTCRPLGFGGAGPIPWLAINTYAHEAGLEPDVALGFPEVIRSLDHVWLEWQDTEQERMRKQRQQGNTGAEGQTFGKR